MSIRTREEVLKVALETTHNTPGFCQGQVRAWFLAPSVGDFDGDGAADAEDGWKSEPERYKHHGDRTPPYGVPLSFLGGSNDNGHRALALRDGKVRSTDFDTATQSWRPGVTGTAHSIGAVERALGVSYVGWSETIDGQYIPHSPWTRGDRVDEALHDLNKAENLAKDGTKRDNLLKRAIEVVKNIPRWRKR